MSTDTATLASPTFTLEEVAAHFEGWRRQKRKADFTPGNRPIFRR